MFPRQLHARNALGLVFAFLALISLPAHADEKIIKSHGISIFGDLKYGKDFKHFDYVNPDAPKGGEFSTWGFGTFDSLTPFILKGQAPQLASIFFESLLTGSSDEADSAYGLLAESLEYPESRQWVIFNLRPEAKFSDGTQVTAEDVIFSHDTLVEFGRPVYKVIYEDFESIEALSPTRVKFTFKEGVPTRRLPLTAGGIPIFSKAYYEGRDFAESTLDVPVGSSEYTLDRIEPGKTVVYKRRDDYWGKDLPVNQGRSNFDKIRLEYYADYTAAFEGFKGGVYNFREEYLSKLWATSYDFPALQKGWVIKDTIPDGTPSGTQGFFFNLRRDKFKDPRVREAIAMAFNFEWSNKTLFYDLYERTDSFFENSPMQATGLPTAAELALLEPLADKIPASVLNGPAYTPPISKPAQLDRGIIRRAKKLLADAGWTVKGGKLQNEQGEVLTLEFLNDSPSTTRIVNPFVENLKRLGIDASLRNIDAAQMTEREKVFDYDMVTTRFVMSLTPTGTSLRQIFGSRSADLDGSSNRAGVKSEAVDALIDQIDRANSREELNTAVSALDRVLRAMHIWVPNWYKGSHNVAYLNMYEYPENLPPYAMGEMDFWWYNAEKAEELKAAGAIR